jgi:hypothetical protein
MFKFFKGIVLFSIPLLIVLLFFEIFLRNVDTLYIEKKKGLEAAADSVQLLILGNSHGAMDFNPDQFNLYAYNMAQVDQSLYFDKRIALQYISTLPRLKVVLINLDFHSFYFSSEADRDNWTYYAYHIDYKNQLSLISKISYVYGYSPKIAFEFLKRRIQIRHIRLGKHLIDINKDQYNNTSIVKGWLPFLGNDTADMNVAGFTERAKEFNQVAEKSNERTQIIDDLEDFIVQLKNKNITPIFITAPCYSDFRTFLNKNILIQNQIDINNLCNKYHLKYFNFFEEPFGKNEYYDCDHLNDIGANRFSHLVNDSLKNNFH